MLCRGDGGSWCLSTVFSPDSSTCRVWIGSDGVVPVRAHLPAALPLAAAAAAASSRMRSLCQRCEPAETPLYLLDCGRWGATRGSTTTAAGGSPDGSLWPSSRRLRRARSMRHELFTESTENRLNSPGLTHGLTHPAPERPDQPSRKISAFTYQFLSDVVGHWLVNSELTIVVDY